MRRTIPMSASLPFVLHLRRGLDGIAFQRNVAHLFFQADTDRLFALARRAGIAEDVVLEDQAARLTTNANPRHRSLQPIVLDDVLLQPIAMGRHPLALLAEK